ncbi:MAG: hypothetical protein D6698_06765 [Gammaproteobacteria bacterium]|nr:MAG: hypothetical protein D6698_06765 [Gammaproteobacteria bacterium]
MSATKFKAIDTSTSGNTVLVAAASGKKIRVLSYTVVAGGPVTVKFNDGSNDLTGPITLSAAGDGGSASLPEGGLFETPAGSALNINLSAAVQVGGHITYIEVMQ